MNLAFDVVKFSEISFYILEVLYNKMILACLKKKQFFNFGLYKLENWLFSVYFDEKKGFELYDFFLEFAKSLI